MNKRLGIHVEKTTWIAYLLLAPAIITICGVVFVPAVKALLMSFQSYDLRQAPDTFRYIGLENYNKIIHDSEFWDALLRTVEMTLICVTFQFILGFALALLLNRPIRGRGVLRAVSMIPWVIPGVLAGLIWRWMYDGNYGVINDILTKIGITKEFIPFLAQPETALISVCITYIWQGIPFFLLMILAALQGIPAEIYDAAAIDGASPWQRLIHVVIPSIRNSISVSVMLRIIWVANSVDIIYNMTEGGPANRTRTLAVFVYQKAKALNLGYSSALAMLLMLILMTVAIPYLINQFRHEES